jgi:hypothetical protein
MLVVQKQQIRYTNNIVEATGMGVVSIELSVKPTSINGVALEVRGHVFFGNAKEVEVSFEGWAVSHSKRLKSARSIDIALGNLRINAEKSESETEFELLLTMSSEMGKQLKVSKGKDYMWRIVGNYYPFIAQKFELPLVIRSPKNKINLTVNLVLEDKMIPYGGSKTGFEQQSSLRDGKFHLWSGTISGEGEVSRNFGATIRFAPLFAFREALSPAAFIYAAGLITQVLQGIKAMSLEWEFLNVSIEPTIALTLLQMIVNVYLFLRISKIKVDIVGTRSLLTALKVGAWAFMGLLIVNATYPGLLAALGFNIFDLILKATHVWIVIATLVSLFVYPYIRQESRRSHILSAAIVLAIVLSILYTTALPQLSTASHLLGGH